MTEITDIFSIKPDEEFKVVVTNQGRKVYFEKDCLERVTVLRRINGGEWKEIAKDIRTPFVDTDVIANPADIEYGVSFKEGDNSDQIVKVHLP